MDRAWSERLADTWRNREASQSVQDSVQVEVSGDAQAIGREVMSALSAMDNRYSIGFVDAGLKDVVVARTYAEFSRYCSENGLSPRTAIFLKVSNPQTERYLRGLGAIRLHRADGAVADARTEIHLLRLTPGHPENLVAWATRMMNEAMESSARYAWFGYRQGADHPEPEPGYRRDETEPGARYEPHGQIHTLPASETAWSNPHHWPSTVERSPYWDRAGQVLKVPGSDTYLIYTKEELDEDVRYV